MTPFPSPHDVGGGGGAHLSAAASEALNLRRAARLVHCLQKERGASCALCAFASRPGGGGGGRLGGDENDELPTPPLTHPLASPEKSSAGSAAKPPPVPTPPPMKRATKDGGGGGGVGGAPRPFPLSPRRSSPRRSSPPRPSHPPPSSSVSFSENDEATHAMLTESLRCARRNADAAIDLLFAPSPPQPRRSDSDLPVRESLAKIRKLVDSTTSGASGFDQGLSSPSPPSAGAASALAAAESAAAAALPPRPRGGASSLEASPLRPPPSPLRSPERSSEAVGFHRILVAFNALVGSVTYVCIVQRCDALKRRARGESSPSAGAGGDAVPHTGRKPRRRHRKTDARSPKKKTNSSPMGEGGIGGLLAAYDSAADSLCGPGNDATVESKKTVESFESTESSATPGGGHHAASLMTYPHRASSSLPIGFDDGSSSAAPRAPAASPPRDVLPSQYSSQALPPPPTPSSVACLGGGPGLPPRGRLSTVNGASVVVSQSSGTEAKHHRKIGSDFILSNAPPHLVQRRRTNLAGASGGVEDSPRPPPSSSSSRRETSASNRASSLISLLLSFVRLKESTGVERAVLSSLMVMGGGGGRKGVGRGSSRRRRGGSRERQPRSFGEADSPTRGVVDSDDGGPDPFARSHSSILDGCPGGAGDDGDGQRLIPSMLLFSDLVLEEENRRRIVRELRRRAWDATTHGLTTHLHESRTGPAGAAVEDGGEAPRSGSFRIFKGAGGGNSAGRRQYDENYKSLLALVDQAVRPSPEMEYLHNTIRVDFDLKAFQRAMSLEEFWAMITAYIDRLHALELLIVEELECCLATAAAVVADAHANVFVSAANTIVSSSQNAGISHSAAIPPTTAEGKEVELATAMPSAFDEQDSSSSNEEKKCSEEKAVATEEEEPVQDDAITIGVSVLLQALNLSGNGPTPQSKDEAATALAGMSPAQLKESLLAFLGSPDGISAGADVSNRSATSSQTGTAQSRGDRGAVSPLLSVVDADLPPTDDVAKEWEIDPYELEFRKRIGRGVAGTTYLAHWSGQKVAVKVAAITDMGLEGWNTEVRQLQRLHHPNIIRFLGSIYNPSPRTYGLVLEYCDAGDLSAALSRWTPPAFFFRVAGDVANGMAYLHGRRLLHRDIKPANILLHGDVASGNFTAKLTDFGVATITQSHSNDNAEHTAETGTYRWMAPEVIRHESYSFKADVFSFALVVWQLITREEPFCKLSQIEAAGLVALESARPPFPLGAPPSVTTFIERCWSENPDERQSFDEIKNELRGLKKAQTEAEREWIETAFGHPVYEVLAPSAEVPGSAGGNLRKPPPRSKSWHEGENAQQSQSESEASENERGEDNHRSRIKGNEKKKSSGWGFLGKKKKRGSFAR